MPALATRASWSASAYGLGLATASGVTYTWIFDKIDGGSFTVPTGVTSMTIEGIGPGAPGKTGSLYGGPGGGGGAYAKSVITVTPGNTAYLNVGSSSAGTYSWFNKSSNASPITSSGGVLAKAGLTVTTTTGGAGGASGSCVGQTTFSGGQGGSITSTGVGESGGGGGAGGPNGAGKTGGSSTVTYTAGAGGGAGGTSSTNGDNGSATVGATGGLGPSGTAGGVPGTLSTPGQTGYNGAGGGAPFSSYTTGASHGGAGSNFDLWGAGNGPSGGSGAGSFSFSSTSKTPGFGGGGGGAYLSSTGGNGVIAVTFTVAAVSPNFLLGVGPSNNGTTCVAGVDGSGNLYLTGAVLINGIGAVLIMKTDPTGKVLWQRTLNSSLNIASYGPSTCDASFNVYVAGFYVNGSQYTGFLAKYNSTGVLQWQRTWRDTGNINVGGVDSIAIDSSGNIWVGGTSQTGTRFYLVKYNASGTYQNAYYRTATGSNNGAFSIQIVADPAGYLYIETIELRTFSCGCCGCVTYFASYLGKYGLTLTAQWGQTNPSNGTPAYNAGVAVDGSSNVYWGFVETGNGYLSINKFNSAGTAQWSRTIQTGNAWNMGAFYAANLTVDGSGRTTLIASSLYGPTMFNLSAAGAVSYSATLAMNSSTGALNLFTNAKYVSPTVYFGNASSYGPGSLSPDVMAVPSAGLTAGTYGPLTVTNVTPTTTTAGYYSSWTPAAWTGWTATDAAGSLTDAAGAYTTIIGYL